METKNVPAIPHQDELSLLQTVSRNAALSGLYAGFTGVIRVTIVDGGSMPAGCLSITINGTPEESISVPSGGIYNFVSNTYLADDLVQITLVEGAC